MPRVISGSQRARRSSSTHTLVSPVQTRVTIGEKDTIRVCMKSCPVRPDLYARRTI